MKTAPPARIQGLFWDVDQATLDCHQHRAFILDRVLEYGDIEAVRWAEATYGTNGIRDYFLSRGVRVLSAKTRAFWQAVLKLTDEPCTPKFSPQRSNPLWPF
jgi:hypothetical protein